MAELFGKDKTFCVYKKFSILTTLYLTKKIWYKPLPYISVVCKFTVWMKKALFIQTSHMKAMWDIDIE